MCPSHSKPGIKGGCYYIICYSKDFLQVSLTSDFRGLPADKSIDFFPISLSSFLTPDLFSLLLLLMDYSLTSESHGLFVPSICCCSVAPLCPILCNPMDSSTPSFPVLHHLPEFAQSHVHSVSDAIQPSHPLLSTSPPAFNLFQHQGLFQ